MKTELLSPVGNKEMLYQAIHNGADAVYLAGTNYGARKYAQNFTNEELKEAVKYAHLYNVKVYVTINTMIYEEEVQELLEYVKYLQEINVDALIVSDVGMINVIHHIYPNMDMHASTQCHIQNKDSVEYYKKLGITRVVFARETSIDTIKNIPNNIEKEIFVHGALCICYSGCCLFSSITTERSGNRGSCTAPCRKKYNLVKDGTPIMTKGKYLLSTKDLNTTSKINEILELSPACLKIEGRMKSPQYVGYVTSIYRKLIDNYYQNKNIATTNEENNNLKKLYNRKFTTGYLFNDHILNSYIPNNNGVHIGNVVDINKKYIKIKLIDELNQEDGLKFFPSDKGLIVNKLYNNNYKLINSSKANDIIYIENKIDLKTKDKVLKTIDKKLNKSLEKINLKKMPIDITLDAYLNKPAVITLTYDKIKISVTNSTVIEKALTKETTKEEIIKQLIKLGDTPYYPNQIKINMDNNIFIPMGIINSLRREAISKINKERLENHRKKIINTYKLPSTQTTSPQKNTISMLIRNKEQLETAVNLKIDNIYTEDYKLYQKYKNSINIYYKISRIEDTYPQFTNEKIMVSDYGAFNHYKDSNTVITDYTMNIANNPSAILLDNQGAKKITLSIELSISQIKNISNKINTEIVIYGTPELMVIKPNLINEYTNNNEKSKYYLNENNKYYQIIIKSNHTYIYNYKPVDKINEIKTLIKYGIKNYRIDLLDEKKEEIKKIIHKIRKELNNNE